MLTLYGCGSPNVFKVIFALSELELPFDFQEVDVASLEQYRPEFRALNPNCKVPVLVDSDGPGGNRHTVFESGAILIYLAEKSGQLMGADPAERSITLQWLMLQMASIGPMFGQAAHFQYIAPAGNDYGKRRYSAEVNRLYGVLAHRLDASPWLAGEHFSIADIATYPWAGRYAKTLGVDMAGWPSVTRWIAAIEARPGWQRVDSQCRTLFKQGLEKQQKAKQEDLDIFFGRAAHSDG